MKDILIASSNSGKIAEFQALLSPVICIPQTQFGIESPEECGLSFIENAIIKARHASLIANMPALADDSGLVVEALSGKPGIYSARYAGTHANDQANIDLLLHNLAQSANRNAFFYCAIALVKHAKDPTPLIACGKWEGCILDKPRGTQGFGYDPVFYVDTHQCSAAELPPAVKNTLSHRGRAMDALRRTL